MSFLRSLIGLADASRRWTRLRRQSHGGFTGGPFGRSFDVRHLDAGSCNACELELQALSGPAYDISRFGMGFVPSPRHADAVMLTGPITRNLEEAVRLTVEATPHPRVVIACGDCACGHGPFAGSYAVVDAPESVVHADVRISGCPPTPQAILDALMEARGGVS